MSLSYIDGQSHLSIESPRTQPDGTLLYSSKLITPSGTKYLGLFDQSDEVSMFYFQRGYEPEINYLLEIAEPRKRKILRALGFSATSKTVERDGKTVKTNRQYIPGVERWNKMFAEMESSIYFDQVDSGLYPNEMAEELYFEDGIAPVSSKEPYRFHDLSVHPIGHFLISGDLSQELLRSAYQVRKDNYSPNDRRHISLWSRIDDFSEELGYGYINGNNEKIKNKIVQLIASLSVFYPGASRNNFHYEYQNPLFINELESEILDNMDTINNYAG